MRDRYTSVDDIAYSIESASYADLLEISRHLSLMASEEGVWDLTDQHQMALFLFSWAENRCDEARSDEKVEELKQTG